MDPAIRIVIRYHKVKVKVLQQDVRSKMVVVRKCALSPFINYFSACKNPRKCVASQNPWHLCMTWTRKSIRYMSPSYYMGDTYTWNTDTEHPVFQPMSDHFNMDFTIGG